jgi:Fe-S-cluster containining protein
VRHEFERTKCACENCTRCCKRQPGPLVFDDIQRIKDFLGIGDEEFHDLFVASPGALVKAGDGKTHRVGSIVPRMRRGRCVFLDEKDRCRIHAVAPFGCAYFDTHMSAQTAHPRSLFIVNDNMSDEFRDYRDGLDYTTSYKPSGY